MPSSRGSSQPSAWTQVSHIAGRFFTIWATREAQEYWSGQPIPSPGKLPDPGIEPGSPALQKVSLASELLGKPILLSITSSANIFLPLVCCFFYFVGGFICCEKTFKLGPVCLSLFFFALGGRPKEIPLLFMSKIALPLFPSMSFMVSGLTFKFLIRVYFCIQC